MHTPYKYYAPKQSMLMSNVESVLLQHFVDRRFEDL
jgi:hypothetical protein